MYKRLRFVLLLAFGTSLFTSCQQISTPELHSPDAPQTDPDSEEYVVYNALLENKFAGDPIDQILMIDHTRVNSPGLMEKDLEVFQEYTPLAPELITNFKERNQHPYQLKPVLDFGLDYQLLTQEEVDEIRPLDEASGWRLLDEKFPNSYGFVYLSRVGFNGDFSQSLVYMSSYRYEEPIQGGYYFMIIRDGSWIIESAYEWQT